MMHLTPSPRPPFSLLPCYGDLLSRTIGVLQHLQVLIADESATLEDVQHLITATQQEFGPQAPLEQVIQALAGRHLQNQRTDGREGMLP